MTPSNRQIFLNHVGQTSGASLSLEVSHADGIYLYTPDGKRYIDLVSGVSVSSVGHGNNEVVQAISNQAEKHLHLMVYGEMVQAPQTAYAEWLVKKLPPQLDNIYYVNSGSEAIEGAMKLAKRFTGRPEIIAFKNAYHGSTQGALSILGGRELQSGFFPLLPGIQHIGFNNSEELEKITENTAAVVIEPIQAEAGIIEADKDFFLKLRKKCDQTGTMLILDEIQTGMGRTGKLFAFEHYNIVPDILCLAKSFGGGMPLGAFLSSRSIMNCLALEPPLGHITTFGGHPVCCAAGLAAQVYIEKHALIAHGREMELLYRNLMKHDAIEEVRGKGLFLAVVLKNVIDPEKLMQIIFDKRLIVDQFLFCRSAFRIAPPLIIKKEEVEHTSALLLEAISEALR